MQAPAARDRALEWYGGSLDDLIEILRGLAITARIEVVSKTGSQEQVAGEVHMLAGGIVESICGAMRNIEAIERLRRCAAIRFRVEPRLPNPETGALEPEGLAEGSLTTWPLPALMRYCETYVMTCRLEVWRGDDHATIDYRRGELTGTTVGGEDAPDRLREVLTWKLGRYHIALPLLVLPPPIEQERPGAGMRIPSGIAVSAPLPATPPAPATQPPRDTISIIRDEKSTTIPGLPVAVFNTATPARTTNPGLALLPAPPAGAAPTRTLRRAPAFDPGSPDAASDIIASPRPAEPEPSLSSFDLTTPVSKPPALRLMKPPETRRPLPRRTALKPHRTVYDLPVSVHVAFGLALGMAVVGIYYLVFL